MCIRVPSLIRVDYLKLNNGMDLYGYIQGHIVILWKIFTWFFSDIDHERGSLFKQIYGEEADPPYWNGSHFDISISLYFSFFLF